MRYINRIMERLLLPSRLELPWRLERFEVEAISDGAEKPYIICYRSYINFTIYERGVCRRSLQLATNARGGTLSDKTCMNKFYLLQLSVNCNCLYYTSSSAHSCFVQQICRVRESDSLPFTTHAVNTYADWIKTIFARNQLYHLSKKNQIPAHGHDVIFHSWIGARPVLHFHWV